MVLLKSRIWMWDEIMKESMQYWKQLLPVRMQQQLLLLMLVLVPVLILEAYPIVDLQQNLLSRNATKPFGSVTKIPCLSLAWQREKRRCKLCTRRNFTKRSWAAVELAVL
jgi:hypothetical protein